MGRSRKDGRSGAAVTRWWRRRRSEHSPSELTRLKSFLDTAPGPNQWHAVKYPPLKSPSGEELRWYFRGDYDSELVLASSQTVESVFFDMDPMTAYMHTIVTLDSTHFLIYPRHLELEGLSSVPFMIFDTSRLAEYVPGKPGGLYAETSRKIKRDQWMKSNSVGHFQIDTKYKQGLHDASFPSVLKHVDEILALCTLSYGKYTIYILWPRKGQVFVSPQRWYNKSVLDYDYQWITCIARDSKTANIVGHGVRMGLFLLNPTAEKFLGWIQKDEYVKDHPRK